MTISYEEMKMLKKMVWIAIKNGNSVETEAFDPTPEQYVMLCDIANRLEENINRMQEYYNLD